MNESYCKMLEGLKARSLLKDRALKIGKEI
jgi:hypothetical protein